MPIDTDARTDFIPYPTQRVVGTIADAHDARSAIEALLQQGFQRSDIDVLRGEEGLRRLDPSGSEHGFFAQFQRTVAWRSDWPVAAPPNRRAGLAPDRVPPPSAPSDSRRDEPRNQSAEPPEERR